MRWRALALMLIGALCGIGGFPAVAGAHGPGALIASSYVAKLTHVPAGLDPKVVDGDRRMWLRAPATVTVVVLDYRGAPYLRFSAAGVDVNQNSEMYYLNQTPVAETPPSNLSRTTPPDWHRVTDSHEYGWHDGRLHALAAVALSPGVEYVGRWSIPMLLNGRPASISGGLWHAENPSIAWFWPIVVLLLCVQAGRRVRRPALDALVDRGLAIAALAAIAVADIGLELHGRPNVSVFALVEFSWVLGIVMWGLDRVVFRRPGSFSFFVIAFIAVWEGLVLIPTLLHGFVLMAVPAFLARAAAVLCLGCGAGLLLITFGLPEQPDRASSRCRDPDDALGGDNGGVEESLV